MDWLEPLAKWAALLLALFGGFALQRARARKAGTVEERLKQAEEGNRAQERQAKAMLRTRKRDMDDDLARVRNRKNR